MQDLTNTAWQQAQLSLKYGALVLRDVALHSCAALIASVCATVSAMQDNRPLTRTIDTFITLVSPGDAVTLGSIMSPSVHQRILSSNMDLQCFRSLLNASLSSQQSSPPFSIGSSCICMAYCGAYSGVRFAPGP